MYFLPRVAGGEAKVSRFAGDPATMALGLGALLGIGGTTAAGVADWFGETNAMNSGELPLNYLINFIPPSTTLLGATTAAAMSPEAMHFLRAASRDAGNQVNNVEAIEKLKRIAATGGDRASAEAAVAENLKQRERFKKEAENERQRIKDMTEKYRIKNPGITQEEAIEIMRRRGGRSLMFGSAIGSLSGAVPAVMMMQDQPVGEYAS